MAKRDEFPVVRDEQTPFFQPNVNPFDRPDIADIPTGNSLHRSCWKCGKPLSECKCGGA